MFIKLKGMLCIIEFVHNLTSIQLQNPLKPFQGHGAARANPATFAVQNLYGQIIEVEPKVKKILFGILTLPF